MQEVFSRIDRFLFVPYNGDRTDRRTFFPPGADTGRKNNMLSEQMIRELKEEAGAVAALLTEAPVLMIGTRGLDKQPAVRPILPPLEQGGALWFAAAKNTRLYAELSLAPACQLCVQDPESGYSFRLSGKASFSEEPEILDRCLAESPRLRELYAQEPALLLPFCLTGMHAEFDDAAGFPVRSFLLPDADGLLTGPVLLKKTELRDRLLRILEEREAEGDPPLNEEERELRRLRDGLLLVLAEQAKAFWPRMNVQPLERAVRFETYDEREEYMRRAKKLAGSVTLSKPEDLTYWLAPDTLRELPAAARH